MISNFQITDDTPISLLTVGQQRELLRAWFQEFAGAQSNSTPKEETPKRYLYGIAGIASFFQVSYVTACKLKEGVLKPAILQQGRKIMCDADMAIELFRNHARQ